MGIFNNSEMKTQAEIRKMLEEVEADDRLHYEPALVQVNAPLALIQVELATRANTLRNVLGLPYRHYGRKKPTRSKRKKREATK